MEHVIRPDSLSVAVNEGLTEKPRTMALGFDSTAWTGFVGAWFVWMLTFIDLDGRGRTVDFPRDREPYCS